MSMIFPSSAILLFGLTHPRHFCIVSSNLSSSRFDMERLCQWDDGEGRFAITRKNWEGRTRVGKGGNAEFFEVEAIKISGIGSDSCRVGAKVSLSEENDQKIEDEIRILKALGNDLSPAVPKFLAALQLGGRHAFITKLYDTNLAVLTLTRQDKSKPLPHVICFLGSLFRGLAHAARHNVIHRDIKPNNIVRKSPESSEAILIDWGGSILANTDLSKDSIMGAPAFISPESTLSCKRINDKSDVFCAGLNVASLLIGDALIKAAPLKPFNSYRKRILENISEILGPLKDTDVAGMVDPLWNDSTKPSSSNASSSSTIASKINGCGLSPERERFFCQLIQDSLIYHPNHRPSAFSLFKRIVIEMTEAERSMMTKLSQEEKEEAKRQCGGEAEAKEAFKSLFNTA